MSVYNRTLVVHLSVMSKGNRISVDHLFLGLTRKPMLLGVSYNFAVINALLAFLGYIVLDSWKMLLVAIPVHLIGYMLCSKEPLIIELIKTRSEKCSKCLNKMYHGCNSYDP